MKKDGTILRDCDEKIGKMIQNDLFILYIFNNL